VIERTIVSKNWIKQLHTLPVLHFNRCLTTEYSEKRHTSTATSTLTTKSTYRSLSAQRLTESTVLYVVGSNVSDLTNFQKWQKWNNFAIFQYSRPLFQHTFHICESVTLCPLKKYYVSLTAFSNWHGFCMSGRKLLDPSTYIFYTFISYSKKLWIYPKIVIKCRVSIVVSVYNAYLCTWRTYKKLK
jgi:hypothetical protein